ncbi:hypothetical protein HELRODRAFT_180122 [Helobdella robusta]|uniref:Uncharacterized protein n=1 Tax=Helobdella robusta TaxID=6412 RepID=T1FFH6_HELRO|nr:hypothetical protein HELRODRAFT_180122 [Helobdella robusta]ESN94782.1 hypothetical protein HELRODRAFT_180122 [Helobdella robusta]
MSVPHKHLHPETTGNPNPETKTNSDGCTVQPCTTRDGLRILHHLAASWLEGSPRLKKADGAKSATTPKPIPPGKISILRLIKQLTEDLEKETVKKLKLEDQSSFVIDNQLSFAEHHKVPLPYGFVEKIASRIQIFRPSHRLSKGLSPSLSHAIKMPDLCFLRTSFRNTLKYKRSREGGHEECCGSLADERAVGTTNYDDNNNDINTTVFGHVIVVNADDSNNVSVISDNNINKNDNKSHQSDKCNDETKTTKSPTGIDSTFKMGDSDFNSSVAVKTGNNIDSVNNNNSFCDIGDRNQSINKGDFDDNLYKHAEHDSTYSSLFIADSGYEDDDEEDDTFTVEIKVVVVVLPIIVVVIIVVLVAIIIVVIGVVIMKKFCLR